MCPTIVDPPQSDTTEAANRAFPDGVGDACDPRPGLSGDRLAALHTFVDGGERRWEGIGWSVASDLATASGSARWSVMRTEIGDGLFVRAHLVEPPADTLTIELDGTLFCTLSPGALAARQTFGASAMKAIEPLAGAVRLVAWRAIAADRSGRLRCQIEHGTKRITQDIPLADDMTTGGYALEATGAVALSAVAAYTQPLQPCPEPTRCPDP